MIVGFVTCDCDGFTMIGIILDMQNESATVVAKNSGEEGAGVAWDAVMDYMEQVTGGNYVLDDMPLEAVLLARKLGFYVYDAKRKAFVSSF